MNGAPAQKCSEWRWNVPEKDVEGTHMVLLLEKLIDRSNDNLPRIARPAHLNLTTCPGVGARHSSRSYHQPFSTEHLTRMKVSSTAALLLFASALVCASAGNVLYKEQFGGAFMFVLFFLMTRE